jgi:DNA-binding transcriptional ArsR family regulator
VPHPKRVCGSWRVPASLAAALIVSAILAPILRLDLYKQHLNNCRVHAFDVLGDPVRRRILELLSDGEQRSGELASAIQREFGISQPAVSQHLRVLRESGFASVRAAGTRRIYQVEAAPLRDVDEWLERFRGVWNQRLDALATELARGRRERAHEQPQTGREDQA